MARRPKMEGAEKEGNYSASLEKEKCKTGNPQVERGGGWQALPGDDKACGTSV